jgi:hypothetical protein
MFCDYAPEIVERIKLCSKPTAHLNDCCQNGMLSQRSISPTFWHQNREAFVLIIFGVFNGKKICNNMPKCGARCKSCSLKYAITFRSEILVKQNSTY